MAYVLEQWHQPVPDPGAHFAGLFACLFAEMGANLEANYSIDRLCVEVGLVFPKR